MNAVLPRFLKLSYRREPLISALITIGIVDTIIGGFNDSWSLFSIGLSTIGITSIALLWRLWSHNQRLQSKTEKSVAQQQQYYLPSQPISSPSKLPILTIPKEKSPRNLKKYPNIE
ncbi:hypothetical protein RINTHH_17230 [Richelia intracellularis HH01]|uniref:Uncharacterized protein n=1 Tax=Richelia intracellularis HH01 TaxID=1165094 RepID=M1X132_9NOST|nr:hypothetical protein [Richelia intracellularis]CCH67878.1 hypothetical protein RINTHH_17230 [Richelia intracellularis HH01]